MAIDVVWEDENGAALARCAAPYAPQLGRGVLLDRSHCLQYVDPVGDATFNQLQLPQLVRELEQAVAQLQASRFKQDAEAVLAFVRGCVGVHTYVKFVGD